MSFPPGGSAEPAAPTDSGGSAEPDPPTTSFGLAEPDPLATSCGLAEPESGRIEPDAKASSFQKSSVPHLPGRRAVG